MPYLGEDTPKLGFGLMRLPRGEDRMFDMPQICDMVDAFMGAGLSYFDTARVYDGSETAARIALVERYPRDSFTLATKCAAWARRCTSRDDAIEMFETSLERSGAGYFDYYLLHNVGDDRRAFYDKWDLWDWGLELKKEGRIRHFGFSFHDNAEVLRELLELHPDVEFVQLQINWADWEDGNVQSRKCWEVAREFEKPVIIMEPVKGGTLANLPEPVMEILREAMPDRTATEWALRFAMNTEGLITMLSGMSSIEQMEQNIATWKALSPLSDTELAALDRARTKLAETIAVPCTGCHYCMDVCPVGMNIAGIMEALNRKAIYGGNKGIGWYRWMTSTVKADDCLHCHACESACPQHIPIVENLELARGYFEGAKGGEGIS